MPQKFGPKMPVGPICVVVRLIRVDSRGEEQMEAVEGLAQSGEDPLTCSKGPIALLSHDL